MKENSHTRRIVGWAISLAAALAVVAGAAGAAAIGDASQPADPIGAPGRYALARSDSLWVASGLQPSAASGGQATYADLNAAMNGFSATGSPASVPAHSGSPENFPLVHGRFTDPAKDQVLSLINSGTSWIAASPSNPSLPAWSEAVQAGTSSQPPQALTAGDLDRVLASDDNYYDEAVAVFAGPAHSMQVRVLDYQAAAGAVTTTSLQLGVAGGTNSQGVYSEGALAAGVGDFDGDGVNEIAVAVNRGGTLELDLFRYSRDISGPSLKSLHSVALADDQGALLVPSYRMAVGDLDGDGPDEIALARTEAASVGPNVAGSSISASLTLIGLDSQLNLAEQGYLRTGAGGDAGEVDEGGGDAGPKVAAGLFHYAPDPSGQGGFTLSRDGIAFAWADSVNAVQLQVFDVVPGSYTCESEQQRLYRQQCDLKLQAFTPATAVTGQGNDPPSFSFAAGGFTGAVNADQSIATWGLAVGVDGAGISFYRVSNGQLTKTFATSQFPASYNLVNYDRQGNSVYLGAPAVFTVDGPPQTSMIVQDPPKHLDWIPGPKTGQNAGSWLNVDRTPKYQIDVSSDTSDQFSSTTKTGSDWTIGASASQSLQTTIDEGLSGIDDVKVKVKASASIAGSYDENKSKYDANTQSFDTAITSATADDDIVKVNFQPFYVFRYPIFGATVQEANNSTLNGMYEITIPGEPTTIDDSGGLAFQFYAPSHENGNVLSYPELSSAQKVPIPEGQLGEYTVGGQTLTDPLFDSTYFVGGNATDVTLKITDQTVAGSSRETDKSLKESADLDIAVSSDVNIGVASGSVKTNLDLGFKNSNSWSNLSTSTQTSKSADEFKLSVDEAAASNQAYEVGTAYYYAPDGTEKVIHAVDLTAAADGQDFWQHTYGGRPDPALSLPNKIVMVPNVNTGDRTVPNWNSSSARQAIRGFQAVHPDDAPQAAVAGAPFSTPVAGDVVQLQVPVRNYSLDTAVTGLTVRFTAVPVDEEGNITGAERQIGDVDGLSVDALGTTVAKLKWDTTRYGPQTPGAKQDYLVFVILDPENTITNEIHEWQDRFAYPPTVTGAPSAKRIVDPRTGNLETLESGQNNQGYGAVTITAQGAPTALRATGAARADVRLARDAMTANVPGSRPRRDGVRVIVDQPLEVHVRVDADRLAPGFHYLLVYDGHPRAGGTVIAARTVQALGAHGVTVTAAWVPRTPGVHHLYAEVVEHADDAQQDNADATLDVDVALPPTTAATLRGLRDDVQHGHYVVNPLERNLLKRIDRASLELRRGHRSQARKQLAQFVKLLSRARGKTISPRDAGELIAFARRVSAKPRL